MDGKECGDLNEVGRKDIITAGELSVTRLLHERYLLHRWYEILVPALPPRQSAEH